MEDIWRESGLSAKKERPNNTSVSIPVKQKKTISSGEAYKSFVKKQFLNNSKPEYNPSVNQDRNKGSTGRS